MADHGVQREHGHDIAKLYDPAASASADYVTSLQYDVALMRRRRARLAHVDIFGCVSTSTTKALDRCRGPSSGKGQTGDSVTQCDAEGNADRRRVA